MIYQQKTHDDLQTWAKTTIAQVQCSSAIGHICCTIRTANDASNEILKSTWSVAIPTACEEWDKYLMFLFPDHSPSSSYHCIQSFK